MVVGEGGSDAKRWTRCAPECLCERRFSMV